MFTVFLNIYDVPVYSVKKYAVFSWCKISDEQQIYNNNVQPKMILLSNIN